MRPELFTIPGIHFPVPSYGVMVLIAYLSGIWWTSRRAAKVKADPDIVLNLGFFALIFGTIGGRAFYVIHYWSKEFAHQPGQVFNLRAGGFEVYGGLFLGVGMCCLYMLYKRLSIRLYLDLATPPMLFGMGIGRIGCFLFGCCWGAVCPANLPWGVTFPCGSPPHDHHWQERQVTVPAELILVLPEGIAAPMPRHMLKVAPEILEKRLAQVSEALEQAQSSGDPRKIERAKADKHRVDRTIRPLLEHAEGFGTTLAGLRRMTECADFRSLPVHPAQLYSAVGPLLLAWLTSAYSYRRRRHGQVLVVAIALYSIERFIEEVIRTDNPQDVLGLTVSQGIAIGLLAAAGGWYLILRRMPLHSRWPARPPAKSAAGKAQAEPSGPTPAG